MISADTASAQRNRTQRLTHNILYHRVTVGGGALLDELRDRERDTSLLFFL